MRCVFSMPGLIRVLKSFIILSLVYRRSTVADETNTFNLCSDSHCEHCSSSRILKCSNGAVSSRFGDLCGCCHSCVQYRDFEESCGSQLAVRSLEKCSDSNIRIAVLATTSCTRGLVCENFICKKLTEKERAATVNKESFDAWKSSITVKKPSEIYHRRHTRDMQSRISQSVDDNLSATGTKESISTSLPINQTRKSLSTFGSLKSETFGARMEEDAESRKFSSFDPSGHLINVLVSGREFQLIYGHEAPAEFNFLMNMIDKDHARSIIKGNEVEILNDKFTDVFRYITRNRNKLKDENVVHPSVGVSKVHNGVENDSRKNLGSKKDADSMRVQKNFVPQSHVSQPSKIKSLVRNIRKKRESDEAKTSTDITMEKLMSKGQRENDGDMNKQYGGISVYDVVNKNPRQIENLSQWLLARNVNKNFQNKPRLFAALENDVNGSEINIHITGVPQPMNLGLEDLKIREKDEKIPRTDQISAESSKGFDDFEILDSEASTDVPTIVSMDLRALGNSTESEISENQDNYKNDEIVDTTHYRPLNITQNIQFSNATNYEFTFPESPISIENAYDHDVDMTVAQTADRFKAQLDRIETKAIIIENAVLDIINKMNNNERYQNMDKKNPNNSILRMVDLEDENYFIDAAASREHAKSIGMTNDSATGLSFISRGPKSKDHVGDPLVEEFSPIRSNHHWKMMRRNSSEAAKNSRIRRRRPDRSDRKVSESETNSRRSHGLENGARSSRRRQTSSSRRPSPLKLMQIVSGEGLQDNSANMYYYQHDDPRLFSSDQAGREMSSSSPVKQSVGPFNHVMNRVFPADRSNRKVEEEIRLNRRNSKPVDSVVEESIILLETQIPRSTKTTNLAVSNEPLGQSSLRFLTKYGKGLDDNSPDGQSAFNLFVVDRGHPDFGTTSEDSRVPETLVLPMISSATKFNQQGDREVDVSDSLFPAYLDYVERSEIKNGKDQSIVESSPSSVSLQRNQSMNATTVRSKRDLKNSSFELIHRNDTKDNHLISEASGKIQFPSSFKSNESDFEKPIDAHVNDFDASKSSSKKRSRRSVQMVDWLRAAQEYHERLRQMKIAAIKTWLASREIASDTNLTNVKLFSREVPPYLEQYKPTSFHENFDDFSDESNRDYPTESNDSDDWTGDMSEILTDIYVDDNMSPENDSQPQMSEIDEVRFIEVSSSSGPRKFTITTNGNSTIRIEETGNHDNVTKFEDLLADGSTNRELTHENLDILSDLDYFDHMYESFDTDDEDFDYEDSYSAVSGWLNEFDVIENTNVKDAKEHEKSDVKFIEAEQEDSSARFKRDSPFVLFKARGNAKKDVVIWPSRWMDLMHRHSRLNRTGNTPQRMTKRRSYLRPRKTDSKLISSSFESIAKSEQENE